MTDRQPQLVHVLVLPTEGVASHVAESLRAEGFEPVEVLRLDDAWGVQVADPRLPDTDGAAALEALKQRFEALASQHEGRYLPLAEN